MSTKSNIEKCFHCNQSLEYDFCSNCGSPKSLKRIDKTYLLKEMASVLHFDKGILYTIREMLLRPGLSVRTFINEDRKRFIKPILYLILCSLVYTIAQQSLQFEDGYINYSFEDEEDSITLSFFNWISKHYGYANILMAAFIAFWVKVFFKKYDYNYFEILILLCFIIGTGMLIFSLFGLIDTLVDFKIIDKGFLIGVLYISWGIGQFFKKRKILNFIKGLVSYMLGLLSFSLTVIISSKCLEAIINHF